MITKKRKRIQDKDAKHIHVPQYEDLKIEEFFKWAVEWEIRNNKPGHIMDCFPLVEAERMKFPRQYIADIIYTLAPEDFKQWVSSLTNRRHSKFKEKDNNELELDDEAYEAFMRSTAVSTKKGNAFNMLKESAKRRRSKKQIEKDKADAELKEREIQARLAKADEILAGREDQEAYIDELKQNCLLYTSPSPRDLSTSRMPSSA